jgi:sec-independent protein translocase protein TatC
LGTAAYFVQQQLVHVLLKPANGQHFIYTSPGGGIGFLFEVCTDVAVILSLPLLVYEVLGFLRPLLEREVRRFVTRCVAVSGALAALGLVFGYFLGLPLALHFLSHQFTTSQITPLLTISEYMSFVTVYLAGSALLFQIPLVLIIINRIKPLSPKGLIGVERWVIVIAFVAAMLMAPTINVVDQLIIAGPMILAYQVGVGAIWWTNRRPKRSKHVAALMERDRLTQAQRLQRAAEARAGLSLSSTTSSTPTSRRPSLV